MLFRSARTMLHAFDIFLLSSTKEGFPYTLLEAGLAGIPCIASTVGGIPEIVQKNQTGILINPHDINSLTNALKSATYDMARMHTYARNMHEIIVHDFTLTQMIEKTTELYYS